MTQIVFDLEHLDRFAEHLGGEWPIPVLVGDLSAHEPPSRVAAAQRSPGDHRARTRCRTRSRTRAPRCSQSGRLHARARVHRVALQTLALLVSGGLSRRRRSGARCACLELLARLGSAVAGRHRLARGVEIDTHDVGRDTETSDRAETSREDRRLDGPVRIDRRCARIPVPDTSAQRSDRACHGPASRRRPPPGPSTCARFAPGVTVNGPFSGKPSTATAVPDLRGNQRQRA